MYNCPCKNSGSFKLFRVVLEHGDDARCAGTDFYDVYTGVGARRIRETFEMLRNFAPAVLFIDEFDALGAARGAAGAGDESASIINEMLVQVRQAFTSSHLRGLHIDCVGAGLFAALSLSPDAAASHPQYLCAQSLSICIHTILTKAFTPSSQMDGFEDNRGLVVLGATNRPGAIDAALIRPGRFDRIIYMPLPDAAGRAKILQVGGNGKRHTL